MKHPINPKVDCVFKALLGSPENKNLLTHFINAVLTPEEPPIVSVEIMNPYNEKEFLNDKLSIVDVKACSSDGSIYQIEIQLSVYPSLPARMIYTWADLYSKQIKKGEDYHKLRPTFSLWIIDGSLFSDQADIWFHAFHIQNNNGFKLLEHGGIYVMELDKFNSNIVNTELERWLKFLIEAESIDEIELPSWMQTTEMRQAMNTLKQFSEKDRAYDRYQARQNYLREQRTIQLDMQQMELDKEKAINEANIKAETANKKAETANKKAETANIKAETANKKAETAKKEAEDANRNTEIAKKETEIAMQEIERLKAQLKH